MKIKVGGATIQNVVEHELGALPLLLPQATPEAVKPISWMRPHFMDENGALKAVVQSFIVELNGDVILIDTCTGEGKDIPAAPDLMPEKNEFLARLRATGHGPEAIDYVICTHLHVDHVGWNTTFDGESWTPTFPNARYLFPEKEAAFVIEESSHSVPDLESAQTEEEAFAIAVQLTGQHVFNQSIKPILDSGRVDLVAAPSEPIPGVRLIPTPGHTIGHVAVEIASEGETAWITGDVFHHACQIAHPDWATIIDWSPEGSSATRREVLKRLSESGVTALCSHFMPPNGRIVAEGDGYRFDVSDEGA